MENTKIALSVAPELAETEAAAQLRAQFSPVQPEDTLFLRLDAAGLSMVSGETSLRGDFSHLLPRLRHLSSELLVRAARLKDAKDAPTAIDATAGLGEDSFFLAAAGFRVTLYERNPVVCALLRDALRRAAEQPELAEIAARMELHGEDSVAALRQMQTPPDVILLDPMFPERQKSALVKKKLQMIQKLEMPCDSEEELLCAAISAAPRKLIVKRPPKGAYLAGVRPDYAISGKAVRFDCFVSPAEKFRGKSIVQG